MKAAMLAAVAALIASSASASVIYSNTPAGSVHPNGYNVYGFQQVLDSFTDTGNNVATSVSFQTWNDLGGKPLTVDWAIYTSNPFTSSATTVAFGTASVTAVAAGTVFGGNFDLYDDTILLPDVKLSTGTYWLAFTNGTTSFGTDMFWDENDGPSQAWDSDIGSLFGQRVPGVSGSETFSVDGFAVTPEPATWSLMLAGFAGLGAALRVRRARPASI
jgi:hypothetical protein